MKKLISLLLAVFMFSQTLSLGHASEVVFGDRKPVKAVQAALISGKLDTKQTCLADYLDYHSKLTKSAIWTPVLALPVAVVSAVAGFGVGGALVAAGAVATNALGVVGTAGSYGFLTGLLGSAGFEGFALVRRVKNKFLVKVIANSYDGKGRSLEKFTRRFLRKYKSFRGLVTPQDLAKQIVAADKSRALCDGSLNSQTRGNEFRKNLARKKHIFKFLAKAL